MEHTKGSIILSRMLALSTDKQVTAPCGCELFRSGSDGKSVTFRYCDTHAAAPELLKALEALMSNMDSMNGDFSKLAWPCHCDMGTCPDTMARAAIKAAKGDA